MITTWPEYSYAYDGSFSGFLTCVSQSFSRRERPLHFLPPGESQFSLYPVRYVESNEREAKAFYAKLRRHLSLWARNLMEYSFLTCLPQKEGHIYNFLYQSLFVAPLHDLADERVLVLTDAVRHLNGEAHLLIGFTRFSDYGGTLVGEISPKNRVLPLLKDHFCQRFPQEDFLLFDRTNKEALCHSKKGEVRIIPLESLTLDDPDAREEGYRALWRQFYNTIAIQARLNPKLRQSHMPKRYWAHMTEFGEGKAPKLPS